MMTANLFNADFFKYFVFAQKLLPDFVNYDFYPVAWSLSIEEYFYLVFPLFLLLISKVKFSVWSGLSTVMYFLHESRRKRVEEVRL